MIPKFARKATDFLSRLPIWKEPDQDIVKERWRGIAVTAIIAVLGTIWHLSTEAQVLRWAANPSAAYDTTGSPYASLHVEAAIEEAIWVWETSIPELDISYVGLTLGPVENAVVTFKWSDPVAHFNLTGNIFSKAAEQKWVYLDSGMIAKSVIFLNTSYFKGGIDACQMTAFAHEFGHALGLNGHSPNPEDLMYYAAAHCRYVPTDSDVALLGHKPSACHAILTREDDVYVPALGALLKKQEGDLWALEDMAASDHQRECGSVTMDSEGVITMTDVRSRRATLKKVVLTPVADDEWKLKWAE